MRVVSLFVLQLCLSLMSLCYASGGDFKVLILYEKGRAKGLHEIDAMNIKKTFKNIGKAIEMHARISQYDSNKVSMNTIAKWCSKISRKSLVVVYYSGSNPENLAYNGVWPLIKIGSKAIPLEGLAHKVHSKNARLSLVLADSYNKVFDAQLIIRRFYGAPLKTVKSEKLINELKLIWLNEQGHATICSNRQQEKSYGMTLNQRKDCMFGVFTEALLMHIGNRGREKPHPCLLRDLPELVHKHVLEQSGFTPTKQYSLSESDINLLK